MLDITSSNDPASQSMILDQAHLLNSSTVNCGGGQLHGLTSMSQNEQAEAIAMANNNLRNNNNDYMLTHQPQYTQQRARYV